MAQEELRKWMSDAFERLKPLGKTRAGLSKLLGKDPSAVSKIISGTRKAQHEEVPIIESYLGESAPPIVATMQRTNVELVVVRGIIAAGVWREAESLTFSDTLPCPRDKRYPAVKQYALLVEGNSVNKRAPDGSYVVCAPYWEVRREIQDGDFVHVERRRGGVQETTLKIVKVSKNGAELLSASTDPKWQEPIPYNEKGDTDEVAICGLVVWVSTPVNY